MPPESSCCVKPWRRPLCQPLAPPVVTDAKPKRGHPSLKRSYANAQLFRDGGQASTQILKEGDFNNTKTRVWSSVWTPGAGAGISEIFWETGVVDGLGLTVWGE